MKDTSFKQWRMSLNRIGRKSPPAKREPGGDALPCVQAGLKVCPGTSSGQISADQKFIFLLLALLILSFSRAFGESAPIAYAGRLTQAGSPATGIYDMQFKLFDTAIVGTGIQKGGTIGNSAVPVAGGVFTVTLDFGAAVFDGSPRFLEIGVRTNGSAGLHTTLTPRQQVTSVPYAVHSLDAATAATALNVASGSVVKSLNNLKDDVTLAAGPNVTITPSGKTLTIASTGAGGSGPWSLKGADAYYISGNVGIGTNSPTPGVRLEVGGNVRLHPDGGIPGGFVQFSTPSGETGMSISGVNRADIRFDDNSLKLLAGFGPGAMPSENGIAIRTDGNVGIGTTLSRERLQVGGATFADTKIEINAGGDTYAALRMKNAAGSWLWQATPSNDSPGGRLRLTDETTGHEWLSINHSGYVGIGTTAPTAKLHVESSDANKAAVYGSETGTASVGVYGAATAASSVGVWGRNPNGYAVYADGNAGQARDKGGFVKAMLYVNQDGTIERCYNGLNDSSTGDCGFAVSHTDHGSYYVDFRFKVDDRFVSVAARQSADYHAPVVATFRFEVGDPNRVHVITFVTNVDTGGEDTPFMIIIY